MLTTFVIAAFLLHHTVGLDRLCPHPTTCSEELYKLGTVKIKQ
jgi:hypothetical protein